MASIKDYSNYHIQRSEKISEDSERIFDICADGNEGEDVYIDDATETEKVIIQVYTNPLTSREQDRKMWFKLSSPINTGSIIIWKGEKWLVVSDIENNDYVKYAKITKCNNVLKLYKSGILYEIPCVVEDRYTLTNNLEENKYLTIVDDDIIVKVANNSITQNLNVGEIYTIGKWNWEVANINDILQPGLLILKLRWEAEAPAEHNLTLAILNGSDLILDVGQELQLNVDVYDNGETIDPTPNLIYATSDKEIATVDTNGLVTTVSEGDVTITAKLANDLSVLDSINITIQQEIGDNYTVDVYGSDSVVLGNNITIYAKVYNNGIEDPNKGVDWNIVNQDASTDDYLTIIEQDANSITLLATDNMNYKNKIVSVIGIFTEDITVYDELNVKIVSLF